jgi:ABC-type glycerol-3-phosphate transport system substrate-binding protein
VHLRRALLLFAIVLGLAAIAASVSRPRDSSEPTEPPRPPASATETEQAPSATPGPEGPPAATELTFFAADPGPQRLAPGQAATVYVEVEEPGQVEIEGLGMNASAQPLTPARFELLTRAIGRYPIAFLPASAQGERVEAGTLVVAEPRR